MRSPSGASSALLTLLDSGAGTLLLSVSLVLEYESVCLRAEHRIETGLTSMEVVKAINALVGLAEPVEIHFRWRPQLRDACDEMVLETAVNGRADYLVTFNARDYGSAPGRFAIEVVSPAEAIRKLRTLKT